MYLLKNEWIREIWYVLYTAKYFVSYNMETLAYRTTGVIVEVIMLLSD